MLVHLLSTSPLDLFLRLSLAGLLLLTLCTLLTTTLFRRSSAATRHLTWTATTLALLCLPAFALLPPAQPDTPAYLAPLPRLAPLPPLRLEPLPPTDTPLSPPPVHPSSFSLHPYLLPLYALGLLASLTPLLLGPILLRRLRTRATPATDPSLLSTLDTCRHTLEISRPVTLLLSPSPTAMPLAFGLLRPHILLPADAPAWPPARLRLVLSHELAHIKRQDVLTLCLAQLARAIHWFNPLAYLAVSRMLTERERACDDLVLASTATRPSDYADTLLRLSTTLGNAPSLLPAMPMSRGPSHLHTRLRAILNPAVNRSPLTRRLTVAALLLAPALALPLSCSRAEKSHPESQPPIAGTQRVPGLSDQEVDQYGWTPEMNAAQGPMRDIAVAAGSYANKHDNHLPPTLGDTLPYVDRNHAMSRTDRRHATLAEKAKMYLDPRDYASVTLPENPTPAWVNAHTSYTYLGRSDVNIRSLTEDQFGKTILLHDSLDHPHRNPKVGPLVICAYLDGHSEGLPVDMAKRQIAESQQTLAAAANGAAPATKAAADPNAPWPADVADCARNLRDLASACIDYTETHDRHYPADLGPTVDPITQALTRASKDHHKPTPAELAHKYLCPLLAANVQIPDQVTPDWVRQHTTYTYLGSDQIRLGDFTDDEWAHTVLLHDDLDHPHKHPAFGTVTIVAYLDGAAQLLPVAEARKQIETSKKTLANPGKKSPQSNTAPSTPGQSAAQRSAAPDSSPKDAALRAQFDKTLPAVTFNNAPLSDAFDVLRDVAGLNIDVAWPDLEAAGVTRNARISLNLRDVKVSQALDAVFRAAGAQATVPLTYTLCDGTIAISTDKSPPAAKPRADAAPARPVPFDLGDSSFLPGDSIKIERITRQATATNGFPGGGIFVVQGTYTLASRNSATLGLYVTSDRPENGVGSTALATKGTHSFSLRYAQSGPGHPHLSFYPDGTGGSSFGTLYFGSGPTLLKHTAAQPSPK